MIKDITEKRNHIVSFKTRNCLIIVSFLSIVATCVILPVTLSNHINNAGAANVSTLNINNSIENTDSIEISIQENI